MAPFFSAFRRSPAAASSDGDKLLAAKQAGAAASTLEFSRGGGGGGDDDHDHDDGDDHGDRGGARASAADGDPVGAGTHGSVNGNSNNNHGGRSSQRSSLLGSGRRRQSSRRSSRRQSNRQGSGSGFVRRLSLSARRPSVAASARDEEEKIDRMIGSLTPEQVEQAARTSYAYQVQRAANATATNETKAGAGGGDTRNEEGDSKAAEEREAFLRSMREACARDMARRYLRSNRSRDPDAALAKLASTLEFRQRMDVDGLRSAFSGAASAEKKKREAPASGGGGRSVSPYREPLLRQLSDGAVYVAGFDVEGRSTFVFEPHRVTGHDEEWTIKQHVYTLERAVACSRAGDRTVNAVVNFNHFSLSRHAPPAHIGQQFFTTLRSHYAGHVHQIYLVDAPAAFYCLWSLLKPFVGRTTRGKIQFVGTEHQKRSVLGRAYKPDQAAPWMVPNGGRDRELDLDEYLFRTPFDRAFDEA